MKLARLAALVAALLMADSAHAVEFVLMPGVNLSSPRTAMNTPASYLGAVFGAGLNFGIKGNAHVVVELDLASRRFAGSSSVPTILLPLIGRYESKAIVLGTGPYISVPVGVTSDDGVAVTDNVFAAYEVGMLVEFGFKLHLTRKVDILLDTRITRAFTSAYEIPSEKFYWTNIQGLIGFQFKIGKPSHIIPASYY